MTDDEWWHQRREPMPASLRYLALAGAFTIVWSYLDGNVETAVALSEGFAVIFLALGIAEWALPFAEEIGGRLGEWRRNRGGEVDP